MVSKCERDDSRLVPGKACPRARPRSLAKTGAVHGGPGFSLRGKPAYSSSSGSGFFTSGTA
jgi:hypothetical protein